MTTELHQNDVNGQIRVTVKENAAALNISAAASMRMYYAKPSGTSGYWSASLYTDGTDGIMYYQTSASSDLDEDGAWYCQPFLKLGAWIGKGDEVTFVVLPVIST